MGLSFKMALSAKFQGKSIQKRIFIDSRCDTEDREGYMTTDVDFVIAKLEAVLGSLRVFRTKAFVPEVPMPLVEVQSESSLSDSSQSNSSSPPHTSTPVNSDYTPSVFYCSSSPVSEYSFRFSTPEPDNGNTPLITPDDSTAYSPSSYWDAPITFEENSEVLERLVARGTPSPVLSTTDDATTNERPLFETKPITSSQLTLGDTIPIEIPPKSQGNELTRVRNHSPSPRKSKILRRVYGKNIATFRNRRRSITPRPDTLPVIKELKHENYSEIKIDTSSSSPAHNKYTELKNFPEVPLWDKYEYYTSPKHVYPSRVEQCGPKRRIRRINRFPLKIPLNLKPLNCSTRGRHPPSRRTNNLGQDDNI